MEIRAGKVLSAESIEDSEKLLKLSVDFGEPNPRQVLSGIAKYISPADLVGVTCAFVTNLEPRELMGLKSEAMILAISGNQTDENSGEVFSLLKIDPSIPAGSLVK